MAALCGGPLISVASRLWDSLTAPWLVVLAAIILAAVGTSVLARARRRRADREYENRKLLESSDRGENT